MVSIRKLVSENEKYKLNYFLASRFLKDMGWWQYWKKYIASPEFQRFAPDYQYGCWVGVKNLYSIFGSSNFSFFLQKKKISGGTYTVSSFFMRFVKIVAPKYFERIVTPYVDGSMVSEFAISMQNPGVIEKWKKINLDNKIEKILNNKL